MYLDLTYSDALDYLQVSNALTLSVQWAQEGESKGEEGAGTGSDGKTIPYLDGRSDRELGDVL